MYVVCHFYVHGGFFRWWPKSLLSTVSVDDDFSLGSLSFHFSPILNYLCIRGEVERK